MVKKRCFVSSALSIEFWTEKQGVLLEKKNVIYVKKEDFENRICQFHDFSTKSVPINTILLEPKIRELYEPSANLLT